MANVLQTTFKEFMLEQALTGMTLKFLLVDADDYTWSAAHEFVDDIAGGAIVGESPALSSVAYTNGNLTASNLSPAFTSLSGDESELLLLIDDTGNDATSRIICKFDTATGLAFTPDGNNVNLTGLSTSIFSL